MDYKTKTEQAQAKMREVGADLGRQQNKLQIVQTVMQGFTITAPAPGMVIYVKEWNGRKKTVGSQVSSWEPAVATLPDLTKMESVTYVNEIDVRKIARRSARRAHARLRSRQEAHRQGHQRRERGRAAAQHGCQGLRGDGRHSSSRPTRRSAPGMTTGNTIETLAEAERAVGPARGAQQRGAA